DGHPKPKVQFSLLISTNKLDQHQPRPKRLYSLRKSNRQKWEEDVTNSKSPISKPLSRRTVLKGALAAGAGAGAFSFSGKAPFHFVPGAWAEDHPAIGTWPAGSSGDTVYIGATVPRTGT